MQKGKIYLTRLDGRLPKEIREISQEEFTNTRIAGQKLHEFDYFNRRLLEIQLNKKDIERTIERYRKIYEDEQTGTPITYDYKRYGFVDINRAFINFINSFKSFVEHMGNWLTENHESTELQITQFKEMTSNLYDNHFCYRFLIRVRDFAIHRNYPIQVVQFDKELTDSEDYVYKVNVNFDRELFLRNKTLRKKLGKDLKKMEEIFLVDPFLEDQMPLIELVFKTFIKESSDYFLPNAELLKKIMDESMSNNLGMTTLTYDRGYVKHDTKVIPTQMVNDFFALYDQKN